MSDDEQAAAPRKFGDDALRHAIGEIFLVRLAAQVGEWKHGDRGLLHSSAVEWNGGGDRCGVSSDLGFENVSATRHRAQQHGTLWTQARRMSWMHCVILSSVTTTSGHTACMMVSRLSRHPAFATSNCSNSNAFGRNGISEPWDDTSAPRLRSSLCCPKLNTSVVA